MHNEDDDGGQSVREAPDDLQRELPTRPCNDMDGVYFFTFILDRLLFFVVAHLAEAASPHLLLQTDECTWITKRQHSTRGLLITRPVAAGRCIQPEPPDSYWDPDGGGRVGRAREIRSPAQRNFFLGLLLPL